MSWLLAKIYEPFMRKSERACLAEWRHQLLSPVAGDVLEIGAGTGLNLPHYGPDVARLVLSEPDPSMRRLLRRRLEQSPRPAEVLDSAVETLPADAGAFDVVVSTLVLCSVPNLERALREIRRVLRPGGRLVFIEHVAADDRADRLAWQQRVEPLWLLVSAGCHLTRRTDRAITDAGFAMLSLTRQSVRKALPIVRPSVRGVAIRP